MLNKMATHGLLHAASQDIILLGISLFLFVGNSYGLYCTQCNTYFKGIRNTCDSPANLTDCVGCLKVVTNVAMHDGWLLRRTSHVESKYCILGTANPALRDEGCYYQVNNGGYTERCFCYSDNCNSGQPPLARLTEVFAVLALGLTAFFSTSMMCFR
ncbi:uncharacterized protein LOC112559229 [Pomacea canaliculata]|uniref:uncharacterized protein LOC112559229 n=1 Tax=Pomacea canaliculata TaxID=400727 RepID=UPI000D73B0B9|nr:uncharacterized protein LOC112559229 [Pomacea canaliculata]